MTSEPCAKCHNVAALEIQVAALTERAEKAEQKLAKKTDEINHERLRYGQQRARNAVFMSVMASLAKNGMQDKVKKWVKAADHAASSIQLEDFVQAKIE